jgi:signal transduction histidine kinase
MTETTKDELLKRTIKDFVTEATKDVMNDKLTSLAHNQNLHSLEVEFLSMKDNAIPVEINSKIIDYNGDSAILSVIRDITERKNTEKKVLDAIILTEEKEREKFAKNLHDDLGPLLSSIRMYLNSFMETENPKKQEYIIEQINDILKESIQTTKQISNDLSPHILANYGLISAVETFIDRLTHHLEIHFEHNLKEQRFSSSVEITFYRIIKELINNTIKHASAKSIHIHLYVNQHYIYLDYKDDGIGFDKDIMEKVEKRGMGLFNLMSRIKSLNGKFLLGETSEGARINIEVPLDQ